MIVIAGLGNPGEKYTRNRHNAGFMFVDFIAQWLNGSMASNVTIEQSSNSFKFDKYANAEISKLDLHTQNSLPTTYHLPSTTILLAKPQTYMNRSGESIKKLMTNCELRITNKESTTSYQLQATSLFVAHDDLDIQLGKFKIQLGVGPKKHNGISSIQNHLHTNDFWRIRIGVDNRKGDRSMSGEAYVLQNFSIEETTQLQETFPDIFSHLLTIFKE